MTSECLEDIKFEDDIDGEKWERIEGHTSTQRVSNMGRICHWNSKINGWELNILHEKKGYLVVNNYKKGESKLVHRKVALAFIDNPDGKETVNHKNHIKTCNCVRNLEWMTQKENNADQVAYEAEMQKKLKIGK